MEQWITAKDAAKRAGVSLNTISRYGVSGDLERRRDGRGYEYSVKSLSAWIASRDPGVDFVKIHEAAELLGCSTMQVSRLCRRGDLDCCKRLIGGFGPRRLLVRRVSIEARLVVNESD